MPTFNFGQNPANANPNTWVNTPQTFPFPTMQFPTMQFPNLQTTPTFNPNAPTNVKITTPQMQAGQTRLDKILGTFLSFVALNKGAGYVPTNTPPPQQGYSLPADYYANQNAVGNTGATFGASIEQFVTQNTGLIAVGVVAYVLFKSGRK